MTDSISDLTFVTRTAAGTLDLWTPERTGDYANDCAMGRDYAAELLAHMVTSQDSGIFGAVMRAITRSGVYDAVEIGFCTHLGVYLLGIRETRLSTSAVKSAAAA